MGALFSNLFKSWKTTSAGFLGGVSMLLPQIQAMTDSNPATSPDISIMIAGACMILGGAVARDGDKTSAQVGAEPAAK